MPPLPDSLKDDKSLSELDGQNALFAEARDFFVAVTQNRPLLLVLEDLHWADQASLDLLRYLSRQIANLRLLAIVTYRDDEITRRHPLYQLLPILVREAQAQRIDLHRLELESIRELVRSRYQLNADDEQRLALYLRDHAEGNPFYLGELLGALEEEKLLKQTTEGWNLADPNQVHVPPLVRQVVDQRIEKLGPELRSLLEVAVIIGQVVPFDLCHVVSDTSEEDLAATVERAIEAHILEETAGGLRLRFTHALVREALYEGLVLPRRRAHHRRIGEALADFPKPDPDAIAHHFQQASDKRAREWLIRAGERAQRSYAWSAAVERF